MATSHSLATIGTDANLGTLLRTWKPKLAQILGETDEAAGRFLAVVDACVRRNPDLKNCTVDSFRSAIEDAAALKLMPTGIMNLGWIIPFGKQATFIAGYRGLLDIAYRSGKVAGYEIGLVHKNDGWEYERGLETILRHQPHFNGVFTYENRSDLMHAYAIWWDVINGRKVAQRHLVLDHAELERLRKMSKKSDSGPWRDHYQAMIEKTMVRASTKLMPLTPEQDVLLARAFANEDSVMGIDAKPDDIEVKPEAPPEEGRAAMFDHEEAS